MRGDTNGGYGGHIPVRGVGGAHAQGVAGHGVHGGDFGHANEAPGLAVGVGRMHAHAHARGILVLSLERVLLRVVMEVPVGAWGSVPPGQLGRRGRAASATDVALDEVLFAVITSLRAFVCGTNKR